MTAKTDDLGGYVTDVVYPAQFRADMSPGWLSAVTAWHGVVPPVSRGPFRMLDIGCGDGLGLAVTAASHPEAAFEGIDGMARHIEDGIAFAGDISNIELTHATFARALKAGGPACDFITAHGVIAWVSEEVRRETLDLAADRLAPGGIFAVGYNAMPGWSSKLALQHLIRELAAMFPGNAILRFQQALGTVKALSEAGLKTVPTNLITEIEELSGRVAPGYFPHEYLNRDWCPQWGADIRAGMKKRGLSYIGQAGFQRLRPDLCLHSRHRVVLDMCTDPDLSDTLTDLLLNVQFRVDLYGRAPLRVDPDRLKPAVWLAAREDADVELSARTPAGRIRYDNKAARAILAFLQSGPAPLSRLIDELPYTLSDLDNAADCLLIGGQVHPAAAPGEPGPGQILNQRLTADAATGAGAPIQALAGVNGPVAVPNVQMTLLSTDTAALIAQAKSDAGLAKRLFSGDVDLEVPETARMIDAARNLARSKYARLGVQIEKQKL